MSVWKLNVISHEDGLIRPLYVEAETEYDAELTALDEYYHPVGHAFRVPTGEIPTNILRSTP